MTTLTLLTLAIIAYGVLRRDGYPRALALGGATPAGAALVVGSVAVPTFYAVALGAAVAVVLGVVGGGPFRRTPRRPLPPGVGLLVLFASWGVLVTLLAPLLFDGQPVVLPSGPGAQIQAGALTSSNIAQTIYLVVGICVVVLIARSRSAGPELVGLAAGLVVVLSLWRYGNVEAGLPFPEKVFDNAPFFHYIETAPGGVQRFRGVLSEPSALAGSCLVAICYLVPRSAQIGGWRRWAALMLATAAGYLGVISTSTGFLVAAVVVMMVAIATFLLGFLARRTSVSGVATVVAAGMVVLALWLVPIVAGFVEAEVGDKVGSASYDERSGADLASYDTFLDTFGLGVGLGANRASSFLAGLLSTVGIVGALLLVGAIAELVRRSWPVREYRPVVWALVALLTLKVIAGPDLSDPSGVFWIALGLLSRAALIAERGWTDVPAGRVVAATGRGAGG
ncbi:hypothetical protein [Pseudonocardia alni]|uniref:hypothetical protein n=1 Tax=Pseudonocardia alni TaxID=33907 RepID=UPI0027A256C7|nr:hypothetical protein PaSha_17260 [Pseudonocardia alni]